MKEILPVLALFFLLLSGCVIIPVPTTEHNYCDRSLANNCDKFKTRGEITEELLEFIRPRATTREETLLRVGGPDSVWNNETIFAYQWLMVSGYTFMGVGVASPAAMGGGASMAAWFNKYVLLVEYDASDVIKRCAVKRVGSEATPIDRELIDKWLASARSEIPETCIRSD